LVGSIVFVRAAENRHVLFARRREQPLPVGAGPNGRELATEIRAEAMLLYSSLTD
jgi:hypothetical protein